MQKIAFIRNMRKIWIGALLLCNSYLSAQVVTLSREEQKEEFAIVQQLLVEAHPNLYLYGFDPEAIQQITQNIVLREHQKNLSAYISGIKNAHTWVIPPVEVTKKSPLFPLQLKLVQNRIFIDKDYGNTNLRGHELIAINGKNIEEIIKSFKPYYAIDGEIDATYSLIRDFHQPRIQTIWEGLSENYELTIKNNDSSYTKTVKAISYQTLNIAERKTKGWEFKIIDSLKTAYLDINLFTDTAFSKNHVQTWKFRKFIRQSFRKIEKYQPLHLIIDVRGNQGGLLENAAFLYAYLTDSSFVVSKETQIRLIKKPKTSAKTNFARYMVPRRVHYRKKSDDIILKKHISLKKIKPKKNTYQGKLSVIIDGKTNSAASIFATLVRRDNRGKLIGTENRNSAHCFTAGKSLIVTLPYSKIKVAIPLTGLMFLDNAPIGRGLTPDQAIDLEIEEFRKQKDVFLIRALTGEN